MTSIQPAVPNTKPVSTSIQIVPISSRSSSYPRHHGTMSIQTAVIQLACPATVPIILHPQRTALHLHSNTTTSMMQQHPFLIFWDVNEHVHVHKYQNLTVLKVFLCLFTQSILVLYELFKCDIITNIINVIKYEEMFFVLSSSTTKHGFCTFSCLNLLQFLRLNIVG